MRIHMTPAGPKPCSATKRACKYGEHYDSQEELQAALAETFDGVKGNIKKKKKDVLLEKFRVAPLPDQAELLQRLTDAATVNGLVDVSERELEEAKEFYSLVLQGEIPESFPEFDRPEGEYHPLDFALHNQLCEAGLYGKVTKKVARELKAEIGADAVVLDPMAGKGYGVKALREVGIKSIATDDNSWDISEQVENLDALASVRKYGKDSTHVLLSWPPNNDDIDLKVLELCRSEFPHLTVINIGESKGCTGSYEFWDNEERVEQKTSLAYPTSPQLRDRITFHK